MGELLIVWSIRLSLVCFVAAIAILIHGTTSTAWRRWHRWLWACGFVLFVLHVASAFHFHHGWSNTAAVQETGRQTRELMGIEFGGGVYFNYAFMLAWAFDLYWTLRSNGKSTSAPSRTLRLVRAVCTLYMLFIAFNGLVVFKSGWLRISGVLATIGLLMLFLIRHTSPRGARWGTV